MAGENTVATLNGLFKTVYADKLEDLVPDFAVLQKKIDFAAADKETGAFYAQPVNLSHEAGFTYNGEAGGVTALNAAVNGTLKEAQVKGTEIILRSQMSYGALSRASKAGPKAFKRASAWKVEDMNTSARKRMELSLLYGQKSIGQVSSISSGVITLTDASWAGGIWAGSEGSVITVWSATSASATQRDSDMTITAVDSDAKTVTVSGTSTAVQPNDYIYFKGARTSSAHNDMAGLQAIITNTGTLFNIDASAYSLWKGSTTSSVGRLTFAALQSAVTKAVNKGLMERCMILVSPRAYSSLNTDMAALRMFDSSYKSSKAEAGNESLTFFGANGAPMEVLSHPLVKEGDAFILPIDSIMRIGSTDLTFSVPGMEEQFFRFVDGYNAVELQCMSDQAIFIERPAHSVYLSGVTYT
jgi:hypothetical protein